MPTPKGKGRPSLSAKDEQIIRINHNLRNCGDEKRKYLETLLDLTSNALYNSSTHFLLELIQNADDNNYEDNVTPTLTIVYREDGFLWVGSNESGFSEQDVEAICDVGATTKDLKDSGRSYAGDKGIGFKSVFKIADFVWIRSNGYNFSFDAEKSLGQITPELTTFEDNMYVEDCTTAFCLRISSERDRENVRDRIFSMTADTLLFLQQLSVIKITILRPRGGRRKAFNLSRADEEVLSETPGADSGSAGEEPSGEEVDREEYDGDEKDGGEDDGDKEDDDEDDDDDGDYDERDDDRQSDASWEDLPEDEDLSQPSQKGCSDTFVLRKVERIDTVRECRTESSFLIRRTLEDCSGFHFEDSRRKDVEHTEIAIAFPVETRTDADTTFRARSAACDVFAFTPVRAYGLPFTVQADLILTASRQDIETENDWNKEILSRAANLFVSSVHSFNARKIAEFSWPIYLSWDLPRGSSAIIPIIRKIRAKIQDEEVVRSMGSTLEIPQNVRYLPDKFKHENLPLLEGADGLSAYVSSQYSREALEALEIEDFMAEDFLDLLETFVKTREFKKKSAEWQSRLAAALLSGNLVSEVRALPLVPLQHTESLGRWVKPNKAPLYMSDWDEVAVLPRGLCGFIIDDHAAKDSHRRRLFTRLGASVLNTAKAYDLIIRSHKRLERSLESHKLDVDCLISHAWFIFKRLRSIQSYNPSQIKVATAEELFCPARETYMDRPSDVFKISGTFFKNKDSPVNVLHWKYLDRKYLKAHFDCTQKEFDRWMKWLLDDLKIKTQPTACTLEGTLSEEFRWMLENIPSETWLQFLSGHWAFYEKVLFDENDANRQALNALSDAAVLCDDKEKRALRDIYLPTENVLASPLATETLPLLYTRSDAFYHYNSSWGISKLVKTVPDAGSYLTTLRACRDGLVECTSRQVRRLYRRLAGLAKSESVIIGEEALVYVERRAPKWARADECRWECAAVLSEVTELVPLAQIYSIADSRWYKRLFVDTVGVQDAGVEDVLDALRELSSNQSRVEDIKELLCMLCELSLAADDESWSIKPSLKVFPVDDGRSRLKSLNDKDWFVADDRKLGCVFRHRIPLLDFDASKIRQLAPLLQQTGLDEMTLSNQVDIEVESEGTDDAEISHKMTEELRSKAAFMACLADYHDDSHRAVIEEQMKSLKVRICSNLMRKYTLRRGKVTLARGEDEPEWVDIEQSEDGDVIHISAEARDYFPLVQLAHQLAELLDLPDEALVLAQAIIANDIRVSWHYEQVLDALETAGCHISGTVRDFGVVDNVIRYPRGLSLNTTQDTQASHRTYTRKKLHLVTSDCRDIGLRLANKSLLTVVAETSTDGEGETEDDSDGDSADDDKADLSANSAEELTDDEYEGSDTSKAEDVDTTMISLGNDTDTESESEELTQSMLSLKINSGQKQSSHASRDIGPCSNPQLPLPGDVLKKTDIGDAGELVVFFWLRRICKISDDSWSSRARARCCLAGWEKGSTEKDYADFTVPFRGSRRAWSSSDLAISNRMTRWLESKGYTNPNASSPITYHLEVKTTLSRRGASVEISGNQEGMARRCHGSKDEVYVLLRIWDLNKETVACTAFIDPIGLVQKNHLTGASKGIRFSM